MTRARAPGAARFAAAGGTAFRRAPGVWLLLAALVPLTSAPAAGQATHILVVAGLGGAPEYSARFLDWATGIHAAAVDGLGVATENVVILAEDADADPLVRARSTKENVQAAVAALATRADSDDRVVIVLIGHGSQRADEPRFNLPGPDLTADDVDLLLDRLAPRRVALVNAASASGGFVPVVSGEGRVVLAATKSGRERNETRWANFFVEALAGAGADLDKDGRLSLLEAFTYASSEVERRYQEEGLLLTEHAVLDDNGDGEGSEEPSVSTDDGSLASTFYVGGALGTTAAAAEAARKAAQADPELSRLLEERAALDGRLAVLRTRKDTMEPAAYESALQELLVAIALKDREIRARRGGEGW